MMKQKDAVVQFWTQGTSNGLVDKELNDFIVEEVARGLISGEIFYSDESIRQDEKACRAYAKALTSNHMKRAKEINPLGYTPKTKRGPIVKDERLKELLTALKSLKANNADSALIAQVEAAAEARRQELASQKAASKVPSIEETMAKLAALGITA